MRDRAHVSVPLVDGTPVSVGSIATAAAQRAGERLEARLDHVVRVRAAPASSRCSVSRAALRDGAEELLGQPRARSRRSSPGGSVEPAVGAVRAAGDVDRARRRAPRPSGRRRGRSGRSRRGRRARWSSAWPSTMPGVLDGVVRAGLQVAADADLEVEAAVAGEQVEHVVEEADAGRARAGAGAVERRASRRDVGLAGLAGDLGGAAHRRWILPSAPPSTRRGPRSPRRARSRAPAARERARRRRRTRTSAMRRRKWRDGQAGGEARGAVGRQHVVRAGDVVAERGAARARRRTGSRRCARAARAPRRPAPTSCRCSGASASAKRQRGLEVGGRTSTAAPPRRVGQRARARRARRSSATPRPRASPAPCSAWASRSSATQLGVGAGRRAITSRSLGPAKPSMPTRAAHLALGLLHVEVAGADDHVDARGSSRSRSASAAIACAPPIAVDLVDPAQRARGEDRPGARGGAQTTTSLDAGRARRDRAHDDRATGTARGRRARRPPRARTGTSRSAHRLALRQRRPSRSSSSPASATARTLAIASSSPARTSGSSAVERRVELARAARAAARARRRRSAARASRQRRVAAGRARRATISRDRVGHRRAAPGTSAAHLARRRAAASAAACDAQAARDRAPGARRSRRP